ncbi:MAG TPA: glycosyltransferase, partial [Chromatiaceae bacterium]|nr:glycosyltransferase [Chromatiaceae bacterium]
MKPAKVLILIDRLGRGGVAQVAMNVALSLNRDKFEPIICTTRDKPRNGQDILLREAGIQLVELNRQTRAQLFSWKPLLELLPDIAILHAHSSGSNFWGRLWGTLYHVPVIVTQEHTAVAEKSRPKQWLDRGLTPLSDKIITVSDYDRQEYIRRENLPPDKVETVYVGIDMNRFSAAMSQSEARRQIGCPANKWVVGVIARLAPQKNHKGFLQALALLPPGLRANMHCLLVGSGALQADLTREARQLGLAEQISFLGERQDVPVILRALDLLALPSYWECLPSV